MAGNQLSDEQRNGIRAAIMNSTCTCNGLDVPWRGMTADQVKALTDNELRVYGKWLDSLTQAAERAAVANSGNKGNSTGNAGGSGNAVVAVVGVVVILPLLHLQHLFVRSR
jgi:hypothetical protein